MSAGKNLRIVICGEYRVGKTSIRKRFCGDEFFEDHLSTIGAGYGTKTMMKGSEELKLQIFDLGGQEGFDALLQRYIVGLNAAIMVFDVSLPNTLISLDRWFQKIYGNGQNKHVPFIVIANKNDLEHQKIEDLNVTDFIDTMHSKYDIPTDRSCGFELGSAKTGENINEIFDILLARV